MNVNVFLIQDDILLLYKYYNLICILFLIMFTKSLNSSFLQYVKNGNEELNSRGFLKILDKNFIPCTWEGEIQPFYESQTLNLRSQGHSLIFDLYSSPEFSFTLDIMIDFKPL